MSETTAGVLIIEDEPPIVRFLRATLGSQGYALHEAATGQAGLTQAATCRPDIILLDLGLPDMDGLEVIRRVRGWSAVPIIILSARGQESDKVVTQRQLLKEVWGPHLTEESTYLRVFVHQLRHKLEEDPARPKYILTEAGVGYRFRL